MEAGEIWLGESRMLLFHAKAMGALRLELLETLGIRRARGAMMRMGFACGQQDADLAKQLLGSAADPYDVFRIGPELHALEGLVKATITRADIDWDRGWIEAEVDWDHSWEAEMHLQHFGLGEETACWSLVGYASGYVSRFLNRLVIFRETACMAKGDSHCHIVGKPAEAWGDLPEADFLAPERLGQELDALREELTQLRRRLPQAGELIGASAGFRSAFELVQRAADTPITVLLLGETGVGKEVFAQWLHEHSSRAGKPFVAVNCGAIPHELIESELFGVCKGAYTGAQASRVGRFERAHGGTLFLDEVGDLSPSAQVKLLRVLQTGEFERLGDEATRKADVRLVAATHVNLQQAIAEGRFRSDLYYRLAQYPVTIPPLRERRLDVPLLAASMIEKYCAAYHKSLRGLSDSALRALSVHAWPGNVRELQNLIERGVLLAPPGGEIETHHLFSGPVPVASVGAELDRSGGVGDPEQAEARRICKRLLNDDFDLSRHESCLLEMAVERAQGNLTHAAKLLGISRRQLSYRLQQQRSGGGE